MQKYATALYGRTSKDDQKRVTIEIQQKTLRDWYPRDEQVSGLAGEFWDDGVSGKIPLWERPAGRRLLEAVQAGRVQAVAVAYVDRFGRTLLDGLEAVKRLTAAGARLVAVQDGWDGRRDDSPLFFQFRMMMAEEEWRRIKGRMEGGKRRAAERDNAPPGGHLVFGYRMDEHGRYVPDPVEAPIVVRIFAMSLQGYPNTAILAYLRSTGVPAGRRAQRRVKGSEVRVVASHEAATWSSSSISRILRNPVYAGVRTWGDQSFPCVPLVDPETWERVQVTNAERTARYADAKRDPESGLLSGLLTCGLCGGRFYTRQMPITTRAGEYRGYYRMYGCVNQRAPHSCKAKLLRVDDLDADVWALLESYLNDPEATIRKVVSADAKLTGEAVGLAAEEDRVAAALAAQTAAVEAVWEAQERGGWPVDFVAKKLDALARERKELESQAAALRRQRAAVLVTRDESGQVLAWLAAGRARIAQGISPRTKYELIRQLLRGGLVQTLGAGKQKTAEVTFELKWGGEVNVGAVPTSSSTHDNHLYLPITLNYTGRRS